MDSAHRRVLCLSLKIEITICSSPELQAYTRTFPTCVHLSAPLHTHSYVSPIQVCVYARKAREAASEDYLCKEANQYSLTSQKKTSEA